MTMEGGCFCRSIRYVAEGPPRRVAHCHCLHCRGTSGAPFLTWVEFPARTFRFTRGEPAVCVSRPGVQRGFCAACGTQLTFIDEASQGIVDVTAGSLDEPDGLVPDDHVWADRMIAWLSMDDGLDRYPAGRHG